MLTNARPNPRLSAEPGGLFRWDYGRRRSVEAIDAVIAATALARGAALVTRNARHVPTVGDLVVPYR